MKCPGAIEPPPIGVMPRWLWDEFHPSPTGNQLRARRASVAAAIERRRGTAFPVPQEWREELADLRRIT